MYKSHAYRYLIKRYAGSIGPNQFPLPIMLTLSNKINVSSISIHPVIVYHYIVKLLIEIVIKGWSILYRIVYGSMTIFSCTLGEQSPQTRFQEEFCISHSEVGVSSLTMWLTVAAFKVHYSTYN